MKSIFALIFLLLTSVAGMAGSIETLQLRNRPAAEVIPIIEPLLESGESISGRGFKIFLRASPQTLADVRDLIAGIDVAAKTLMISVMHGSLQEIESTAISGSVRIEGGNVSGSLSGESTDSRRQSSPVHRLRVTEGNEGFIETGVSLPGFAAVDVAASSGFYVLPRSHGDRVTLLISPFRSASGASNGSGVETLQAQTTITGRLGEWLPLGGVEQRSERSWSDGTGQRSSVRNQHHSIWIRADLLR